MYEDGPYGIEDSSLVKVRELIADEMYGEDDNNDFEEEIDAAMKVLHGLRFQIKSWESDWHELELVDDL